MASNTVERHCIALLLRLAYFTWALMGLTFSPLLLLSWLSVLLIESQSRPSLLPDASTLLAYAFTITVLDVKASLLTLLVSAVSPEFLRADVLNPQAIECAIPRLQVSPH